VNVKHKELYKACEEVTVSHIEDYRNEKGEVTGVEKHSWIKEAPKTLFFQIDRVVYDKATLAPQKINDTFDFPTIFYIDPFLHRNKDTALKLQNSVRSLRQKKDQLLGAIEAIERHGARKVNLIDLLGDTRSFLEAESNSMEMEGELDAPTSLPALKGKISGKMLDLLADYQRGLEEKVQGYKKRVGEIEKQIELAYRDINKTPYYLYSLLIHEGGADSGHYYSYTYDFQNSKWRKYNDINITEEAEEQVLKEGKGGSVASAYYLVYAQKDVLVPPEAGLPKLAYKTSNEEGYMFDYYSQLLTAEQRGQVTA
jgi:ubiquitin carboxyl-terminal hydrolase 25